MPHRNVLFCWKVHCTTGIEPWGRASLFSMPCLLKPDASSRRVLGRGSVFGMQRWSQTKALQGAASGLPRKGQCSRSARGAARCAATRRILQAGATHRRLPSLSLRMRLCFKWRPLSRKAGLPFSEVSVCANTASVSAGGCSGPALCRWAAHKGVL